MTRRYLATTFSIAVAGALAIAACSTDEDRNNAAGGEAIRMWLRIVATVTLQDVGPSARPPAASANGG